MNYYDAREIIEDGKPTGRWRYTRLNKRTGCVAVGYCAEDCPGHATPEEAREHYRQWQLDNARFSDGSEKADTLHRCDAEGCEEYTMGTAELHGGTRRAFFLCEKHRNRDALEEILPLPGEIMSSY